MSVWVLFSYCSATVQLLFCLCSVCSMDVSVDKTGHNWTVARFDPPAHFSRERFSHVIDPTVLYDDDSVSWEPVIFAVEADNELTPDA
jgi:hypothetical protein